MTSPQAVHPQSRLSRAASARVYDHGQKLSARTYNNVHPLRKEPGWRQQDGTRRPNWNFEPAAALGPTIYNVDEHLHLPKPPAAF